MYVCSDNTPLCNQCNVTLSPRRPASHHQAEAMGSFWRVGRKVRVVQRGGPVLQQLPPAHAGPGAWKESHSRPVPLPSLAFVLEVTPPHYIVRFEGSRRENTFSKYTNSYVREPVAAACLRPPHGYAHIPSTIQTIKKGNGCWVFVRITLVIESHWKRTCSCLQAGCKQKHDH